MSISIGDYVRSKGKLIEGLEGIITNILEGYDNSNHGFIHIKVTKISNGENWSWVEVGDIESFPFYGHENELEIILPTQR